MSRTYEETKALREELLNSNVKKSRIVIGSPKADEVDKKLPKNYQYEFKNLNEIKEHLDNANINNPELRNYVFNRVFMTTVSQVDEKIFVEYGQCKPNPNKKDKRWDFEYSDILWDLKSTTLPYSSPYSREIIECFENNNADSLADLCENLMIWLYQKQGSSRKINNNRLFLVRIFNDDNEEEKKHAYDIEELKNMAKNLDKLKKITISKEEIKSEKDVTCGIILIAPNNNFIY